MIIWQTIETTGFVIYKVFFLSSSDTKTTRLHNFF